MTWCEFVGKRVTTRRKQLEARTTGRPCATHCDTRFRAMQSVTLAGLEDSDSNGGRVVCGCVRRCEESMVSWQDRVVLFFDHSNIAHDRPRRLGIDPVLLTVIWCAAWVHSSKLRSLETRAGICGARWRIKPDACHPQKMSERSSENE